MKIVVANSVGIDENGFAMIHSPSRWTNSSLDHKVFTYYPWELAYLSSLLKNKTDHEVTFIDGCLEKLDHEKFLERISSYQPDYLIMESSTRTINADSKFARAVKKEFGTKLIFCGQHPTAFPKEVMEYSDYVCLGEYEYIVLDLVQGKDPSGILGLYPNSRREPLDVNSLSWPEDEDVSRLAYGNPGEPSSEYLEVQAYASRGCPLSCSFCVCGNLYYSKPNWRQRNIPNLIAELNYLKNKYPAMEGIFFDEEVHNASRSFVIKLTKAICESGLNNLKYEAMCGYWTLDKEMLQSMKEAGYYLVRLGIETAGENTAREIGLKKKFNIPKLWKILREAKDIGIKIYGTFTFGGPGSSDHEDKQTIQLINNLIAEDLLWKFQLSICTPQPGTPFFNEALEKGYLKEHIWEKFDGGNFSIVNYPNYSNEAITKNFRAAEKYYDISLQNRNKTSLQNNVNELEFSNVKKILLFRSARMWHVESIIKALKNKFKDSRITVIAQPNVKKELQQIKEVDNVIFYDNVFFDSNTFPKDIIREIRSEKFDMAIVPYNNQNGNGYRNVEKIGLEIHSKSLIAINIENEIIDIPTPKIETVLSSPDSFRCKG